MRFDEFKVIGLDPGTASLGVCVLGVQGDQLSAVHTEVIRTQKASKKILRDLRVSADDKRRLQEQWEGIRRIRRQVLVDTPRAIGVEAYSPHPGTAGSSGWKTAMVYGLVCGYGFATDTLVLPFLPMDAKLRVVGRRSATKREVAEAMFQRVQGLEESVEKIPASQQEHATDAAAMAFLAAAEILEMGKFLGVSHE